ncbi:DNA-binding PadR family transcriptional regulator [Actinocorallia herbida]|uniref:DNA-binding PadR family transcriptional regulator n=1 Tax=Actinocorallia herbida TaxID=58109 RepID=A0A3N1CPS0_9ACTN|nr:PadR family transcriptional regulator [Actinocorallia herbida]ROO83311.1 DNA-binding PadR family transcriptional regulator [Actinocorallia herbida]
MSIRHGLLALLARGPRYGYQLRAEFESATGGAWPLNVGQVYTTLGRLERDGLIEQGEADAEGRQCYAVTEAGRGEAVRWFAAPITRADRPRDELVVKLALALAGSGVDVRAVVQVQRAATLAAMRDLTRRKLTAADPAQALVLDAQIFQAEAEIRWLDHCERTLSTR